MPSKSGRSPTHDLWLEAWAATDNAVVAGLFRRRPDLILGDPQSLHDVVARMMTPDSVSMFHREADRSTQQVIETLCLLESPIAPAALADSLGCDVEALAPLIDQLRGAGLLLLLDTEVIVPNPGSFTAITWPCRLGPPAGKVLATRTNTELARITSCLGIPCSGGKAELVSRIVRVLTDAHRLSELLDTAPRGVSDLIETAAQWPELRFSFGVSVFLDDRSPAGWCLRRGLMVETGYTSAVMPREVGLALRGGRPYQHFSATAPPVRVKQVNVEKADLQAVEAALGVVADVGAIL